MKKREEIKATAVELRRIEEESEYYGTTLFLADGVPSLTYSTRIESTGEPEDKPLVRRRRAGYVDASRHARLYSELGLSWIAVNRREHFMLYLRIGGHGLIQASVLEGLMPSLVERSEKVVPLGIDSLALYEQSSPSVTRRYLTSKERMSVLKRDKYRCRLCGASQLTNEHVELHLHHIVPYALGGLTIPENMLTLCRVCHTGLDPHLDVLLYLFNSEGEAFAERLNPDYVTDAEADRTAYKRWADTHLLEWLESTAADGPDAAQQPTT